MNLQQLLDIASRANDLQKEDISELVKYSQAFPYFQLPKVLLAKYEFGLSKGKGNDFLSSAAISSPNRAWLKSLIEQKEFWIGFNQLILEQLQKNQGPITKEENFIDDLDGELTPRPKKDVDLAQKISVLKRLGEELHEKKPSETPSVTKTVSRKDETVLATELTEESPITMADEPAASLKEEVPEVEATVEEPTAIEEPKEDEKPVRKKRKSSDDDLIENIRKREKKEIKDEKKKEQIDIIKAFSKKSIKLATIQEIEANHTQNDLSAKSTEINESLITESYAKLLAKQNKKSKAIEIYQKLMVKFPDKSTYFADQIKNLEDN